MVEKVGWMHSSFWWIIHDNTLFFPICLERASWTSHTFGRSFRGFIQTCSHSVSDHNNPHFSNFHGIQESGTPNKPTNQPGKNTLEFPRMTSAALLKHRNPRRGHGTRRPGRFGTGRQLATRSTSGEWQGIQGGLSAGLVDTEGWKMTI